MKVLVVGANGGVGRQLVDRLLAGGHEVRAMVRAAEQVPGLEEVGAEVVVADLEGEIDDAVRGVDAVAFCAGSGPKTGADKTLLVDLHGAVRTVDACARHGVRRYVMLSSISADDPLRSDRIRHYLAAKHGADRILMDSDLDWTVVRPGGLTDEPATGKVRLGIPRLPERGQIPRDDVAAVMATCLDAPSSFGAVFELISGDTPVADVPDEL